MHAVWLHYVVIVQLPCRCAFKLNVTGCEGGPLPKILIESTETDTSLFGEQGKAI